MQRYAVVYKAVGETPLEAIKRYRRENPEIIYEPVEDFWMKMPLLEAVRRRSRMWQYGDEAKPPKERQTRQKYQPVPMAYAGRLDPMASGKLLILIGDECKKQEKYHGLDKAYRFEVLLGTESDSGDVLGIIDWRKCDLVDKKRLVGAAKSLVGEISLPYPRFSSKTVAGKPLHLWTLENRLDEIAIPIANTRVYRLKLLDLRTESADDVYQTVSEKIETIPEVTEESKRLGADFRRRDVRLSWQVWRENHKNQNCQIATFECTVSSGTYIRSLAPEIARRVGAVGLAYSIERTEIGRYLGFGFWSKKYR